MTRKWRGSPASGWKNRQRHKLTSPGTRQNNRRFADTVDALILYDQDIDTVVPEEAAAASGGRGPARSSTPAGKQDLAAIISAIEDIIRTERQAGGTPLLTSIKQRLLRRYPDFDEKKVGFSGFKKLMSRVAQEGNIRLITAGLVDWAIMADEETPADAKVAASDSAQSAEDDAQEERPTEVRRGRFSFGRRRTAERQETAAEAPEEPPEDEYQPNNRLSRPRWPLQALTMSPTTLPRMFRKMDSQKASPNLSR